MFDMSWGEVLVIGAVALIVIGPKDLPKALRTVGQMTAKMRRMAGEFQSQFNEAMREAELEDVKKQLGGVNQSVSSLNTGFDPIRTARDELKGAIEKEPPKPAVPPSAGVPSPQSNLADPTDMPSVDLPVVPLPPREPPLPAPAAAPEPAVKSPPA
jgi:sec-independent protein translocase protein TatB